MVVKVDLSTWRKEGVGQLTVQSVKTRVQRRPPTIGVIVRVEPCLRKRRVSCKKWEIKKLHKIICQPAKVHIPDVLALFLLIYLPIVMSALLLGLVISVKVRGETSLHFVKAMLIALRVSSLFSVLGNFVIL